MAFGPAAGLAIVDALVDEPALASYHLLPSVRGDLLAKLGRLDEARAEFERAAALTRNERERTLLLGRAAACRFVIKNAPLHTLTRSERRTGVCRARTYVRSYQHHF